MKTEHYVLEALRAYAGKGCATLICSSVCLCGPCHARVALEKMGNPLGAVIVEQTEKTMVHGLQGRWRILSKTSPSGKTLFTCLSCGAVTTSTSAKCAEPVKLFTGEMRECKDWKPSPFEVQ